MADPQTIRIGRSEYVVIPKAEYLRLRARAAAPAGSVDAVAWASTRLGESLREAREYAELTQAALAAKLRVSQSMISQGESGAMRISARYVRTVLKACGLPEDWTNKKRGRKG